MKKNLLVLIPLIAVIILYFFLRKNLVKNYIVNNSEPLSIALINGSGSKLADNLFSKYLQKYNFLVSYVIEINDTFEKTVVIEHIDKNLKNGKRLARCLEYKKGDYPPIYLFLDSSLNLSASIILGKDYLQIIKNE